MMFDRNQSGGGFAEDITRCSGLNFFFRVNLFFRWLIAGFSQAGFE